MKDTLTVSKMLAGVFAYLDAILSENEKISAAAQDHGVGLGTQTWGGFRSDLADLIFSTFRTQFWGSPLKKVMAEFDLYNQKHMADALAAAYCRHKAGRDPIEALNADYGINYGGLLSWEDEEEFRREALQPGSTKAKVWSAFYREFKEGDRIVHYSLPTSAGYMLVRGDRLVWEENALHISISGTDEAFDRAHNKFMALGGYKGFFAGKFSWPVKE